VACKKGETNLHKFSGMDLNMVVTPEGFYLEVWCRSNQVIKLPYKKWAVCRDAVG
jgi:hypothetical protein